MTQLSNNGMHGGVLTQDELIAKISWMREARRAGHNFIKLKLNESFLQRQDMQTEVTINGVMTIQVFPAGRGKGGVPKFDVIVRGGALSFVYEADADPSKDGWYAQMLDDKNPAKYAEKGYNRDWLATHIDQGIFHILDPKVKRDVIARAKKAKAMLEEKRVERAVSKEEYVKSLKQKQKEIEEEIAMATGGTKDSGNKGAVNADNKTGDRVDKT